MVIVHSYVKLPKGKKNTSRIFKGRGVQFPFSRFPSFPWLLWRPCVLRRSGTAVVVLSGHPPGLEVDLALNKGYTLVGGLEHFLFFHILGIIITIDFHIFQRNWNHQPASANQRWLGGKSPNWMKVLLGKSLISMEVLLGKSLVNGGFVSKITDKCRFY